MYLFLVILKITKSLNSARYGGVYFVLVLNVIATETFSFNEFEGGVMLFPDKKLSVAILFRMYVKPIRMFYNPIGTRNEFSKNISNSHMKNVSDDQISDGCYLPIENG